MPNAASASSLPSLSWEDYRLLVESVVDYAIFMLDKEGHVATWNAGAEKIKGYRAQEIIGQHFSKFYPESDVAAGKPESELEIAAKVGRVEDEGWRIRKDGTRFWANVVIAALRDPSGELRGFAKVTRDLSARREAEEELRRSEERFRLLVDNIGDYALYMLDTEGRVTTWNSGAERLKGYRASEIIGQHFSIFFPPEAVAEGNPAREIEEARLRGRYEDEGFRVRKDGSRFWANAILTAMHDASGKLLGFAKITRDLSVRREAEENARRLVREQTARAVAEEAGRALRDSEERYRSAAAAAEAASRAKDEFLATVSHELRTPLSAIIGWSTILKDRVMDPSLEKPLRAIHRNAQAQVRIIEDILDVSRVITGKFRLDLKSIDLVVVAAEATEVVRPSALAKAVTIELDVERDACHLVADAERMQQVVWNLLSNAVKFTPAGGTVRLTIRQRDSRIMLQVSDTGAGIDPTFLPYVFDRFRQADSTSTRHAGGLGLGLALVRHIVELHGGTVEASSEGRGKGATFRIHLPIRAVSPPASDRPTPPKPVRPTPTQVASLTSVRILVVDDEPDARDILATVLGEAGAVVQTAGSAAEGLSRFEQFRPQLVISDMAMPGEDGLTFIGKLRAIPGAQDVPALALTAFTRSEDRERALRAGFNGHLGKPVDPVDLTSAIADLLA